MYLLPHQKLQTTTVSCLHKNSKMSIRTNPMKAVPVLLKRVKNARSKFLERGRDESLDGKMEKLTRELNKIEDVFTKVKKNQDELLDTLHEVDGHLRKLDRKRLDQDMDSICKRLRDCVHKLLPMEAFESDSFDEKSSEIVESSSSSHDPSSTQHKNNNHFLLPQPQNGNLNPVQDMIRKLKYPQLDCLRSLSIFPEEAVIKKKQAIYWWIGLGLVDGRYRTAEEAGEDVFDELLKLNIIVPYGNAKSPNVNKFQINPHIHSHLKPYRNWCEVLKQQNVMLGLDSRRQYHAVFNASSSYLNFRSQWLDKIYSLQVLQLGRCQDSPSHHIEVGNQDFFKNLSNQRKFTYLSLRGISRVFELPPSITKVETLEILDLKACHNLETLPDDISSLKNLTHLILSQCYLLDNMPKGIEKLTELQVLKGFVLGSSKKTPCRLSDLANLKNLRRLSIHIAREAVFEDGEFFSLGKLSKLQHLKISWGVFDKRYSEIQIILPSSLKKLHLEGFPGQKIPEWLKPSKAPRRLKELSLIGGKIESMNHNEDTIQWGMEIVRLKYLKHLEVDLTHLQMLFPSLRYALIKPIPYQSYTEWSIE